MGLVYINDDAWNFFADRAGPPFFSPVPIRLDEEGLRQQVDYYAVAGVTGILFNINAMRAFFDSHTFDPAWKGLEERPDGRGFYRGHEVVRANHEDLLLLCRNIRDFYHNVPDAFERRYDFCRERGVECWYSVRMNDVHHVDDPERICNSDFWRDRPDLRRAAYRGSRSFWFAQCFDYGREEVREHHMALLRELFDRFPMDGMELDWMRSPFHFRPGFAEAGAPILTEFMREARRLANDAAKRRGSPVRLGVRVPSRPEEALPAGLDIFTWAREGLIDWVAPSPYFASSESTLPVDLWRRLLPADLPLLPCLEQHVGGYGPAWMKADAALDAGFAASYYHQGADGIYLFNHLYRDGLDDRDAQRELFGYIGDRRRVERAARRHLVTGHESIVEGMNNIPAFHECLPAQRFGAVRMTVGGGTAGRPARLWVVFKEGGDADAVEVRLNTQICERDPAAPPPAVMPEQIPAPLGYAVPPGAAHDGENLAEFINKGDAALALQWVELDFAPGAV